MSVKRQATKELNRDNWDEEDEPEEMGTFKPAPKEELEKRVIKTAKRRSLASNIGTEPKKSVFSGFGGFNKSQPSSFQFLSNLTNGNKSSLMSEKNETSNSTVLLNSKPLTGSHNFFGGSATSSTAKSTFGSPSSQATQVFGAFPTNTVSSSSVLPVPKTNQLGTENPFKIPVSNLGNNNTESTFKNINPSDTTTPKSSFIFGINSEKNNTTSNIGGNSTVFKIKQDSNINQNDNNSTPKSSSIFGINSEKNNTTMNTSSNSTVFKIPHESNINSNDKTSTSKSSSIFGNNAEKDNMTSNTDGNSTVFKIPQQPNINLNNNTSTPKPSSSIFGINSENNTTSKIDDNSTVFKIQRESASVAQNNSLAKSDDSANENKDKSKEEKKIKLYTKLKGLNVSVSKWVKKHVDETPLCILSPIFKDYERYLKEIQDELNNIDKNEEKKEEDNLTNSPTLKPEPSLSLNTNFKPTSIFPNITSTFSATTSVFSNSTPSASATTSIFPNTTPSSNATTSILTNTTPSSNTTTSTPGFSFGINTTANTTASSMFSFGSNSMTNTIGTANFSFGNNKSLAFGSNIEKPTVSQNDTNDNEDEPPKVEFTPVVEENSVYDKRCKIFIKKEGSFADKGVGTLYIKKIEDTGKHQLLVRANTNLGTVLLNLVLASAIPTQRMGKNNVMLVCIPTPDSKPPPIPVLIRVKTSEEADDLLGILNKYKT